jgi:hypothetical protein
MTYRLDSKLQYWLFVAAIPIAVLATAVGVVWLRLHSPEANDSTGWIFIALWLGAILWGCYRQAAMPHTIKLTDTAMIRFVGALRTSEIAPSSVVSARARGGPFVELKHTGGRILLLQRFTGFHEFLTELKRANPNVTLRGV